MLDFLIHETGCTCLELSNSVIRLSCSSFPTWVHTSTTLYTRKYFQTVAHKLDGCLLSRKQRLREIRPIILSGEVTSSNSQYIPSLVHSRHSNERVNKHVSPPFASQAAFYEVTPSLKFAVAGTDKSSSEELIILSYLFSSLKAVVMLSVWGHNGLQKSFQWLLRGSNQVPEQPKEHISGRMAETLGPV